MSICKNMVVLTFKHLLNPIKAITFNNYKTSGHSSVVERLVANEKVEGSSPLPAPNNSDLISIFLLILRYYKYHV